MQPPFQIDNASKTFSTGGRKVVALGNVTPEIQHGEFICLLEPSGDCKSTLLNAVPGFAEA